MKKYVILISSVLLVLIGIMIEDRGLAMHMTGDGTIIYPISSGSADGLILKLGLSLFAIPASYSLVSIFKGHKERTLFALYSANSMIYTLLLFWLCLILQL